MAEVSIRNIYKIYEGDVQAVKGIDLEIADHEFVVLVGSWVADQLIKKTSEDFFKKPEADKPAGVPGMGGMPPMGGMPGGMPMGGMPPMPNHGH